MEGACARCGSTESLELHHVVPRCNGGENGETEVLCHRCHVQLHSQAGHYAAWGASGAQAVLAQYGEQGRAFLQEIAARGGQTTLARYGVEHMRSLARRGGQATASKDGHLRRIAPQGGQAVAARYGSDYMREIGHRGAQARRAARPKGVTP